MNKDVKKYSITIISLPGLWNHVAKGKCEGAEEKLLAQTLHKAGLCRSVASQTKSYLPKYMLDTLHMEKVTLVWWDNKSS